jgi:predicted nucleotidyltransferase
MAFDIKEMTQTARNYAEDVKQVLPVDKAVLFGSYAKGYATAISDVDVCFFLKNYEGKDRVEIITRLIKLGGKYPDAPFEPIVFETADIQDGNPFVREILATGVELL